MTYVSANRRPNAAALAGAFGIPGAFGALLIVGLAVTVTHTPKPPNPEARDVTDMPLPPPPTPTPETKQSDAPTTTTTTPIPTPLPPSPLPVDLGRGDPVPTFPTGGETVTTGPIPLGTGPSPSPASLYDPVGAKPKGNSGKWVTNDDYRPRWIQEELSGTARFTLQIDALGKVTGCTITRSTGHPALDTATCELVTKRARFDAARDANGKPVSGTYSNGVTWRIPE
ncbi:MAG: energy transducer TonB [Erythrobacter sp.]